MKTSQNISSKAEEQQNRIISDESVRKIQQDAADKFACAGKFGPLRGAKVSEGFNQQPKKLTNIHTAQLEDSALEMNPYLARQILALDAKLKKEKFEHKVTTQTEQLLLKMEPDSDSKDNFSTQKFLLTNSASLPSLRSAQPYFPGGFQLARTKAALRPPLAEKDERAHARSRAALLRRLDFDALGSLSTAAGGAPPGVPEGSAPKRIDFTEVFHGSQEWNEKHQEEWQALAANWCLPYYESTEDGGEEGHRPAARTRAGRAGTPLLGKNFSSEDLDRVAAIGASLRNTLGRYPATAPPAGPGFLGGGGGGGPRSPTRAAAAAARPPRGSFLADEGGEVAGWERTGGLLPREEAAPPRLSAASHAASAAAADALGASLRSGAAHLPPWGGTAGGEGSGGGGGSGGEAGFPAKEWGLSPLRRSRPSSPFQDDTLKMSLPNLEDYLDPEPADNNKPRFSASFPFVPEHSMSTLSAQDQLKKLLSDEKQLGLKEQLSSPSGKSRNRYSKKAPAGRKHNQQSPDILIGLLAPDQVRDSRALPDMLEEASVFKLNALASYSHFKAAVLQNFISEVLPSAGKGGRSKQRSHKFFLNKGQHLHIQKYIQELCCWVRIKDDSHWENARAIALKMVKPAILLLVEIRENKGSASRSQCHTKNQLSGSVERKTFDLSSDDSVGSRTIVFDSNEKQNASLNVDEKKLVRSRNRTLSNLLEPLEALVSSQLKGISSQLNSNPHDISQENHIGSGDTAVSRALARGMPLHSGLNQNLSISNNFVSQDNTLLSKITSPQQSHIDMPGLRLSSKIHGRGQQHQRSQGGNNSKKFLIAKHLEGKLSSAASTHGRHRKALLGPSSSSGPPKDCDVKYYSNDLEKFGYDELFGVPKGEIQKWKKAGRKKQLTPTQLLKKTNLAY